VNGKLTGMTFEIVRAEYDAKGRRSLIPTGEPDVHVECDTILVAIGQENAFPWIERDCGINFDKWGLPVLGEGTFQSTVPNVFLAVTRPMARKTSSPPWRMGTKRRCQLTAC
jgi:NADPH-dependent glutamate synthase beta subunit-like oxidoreductase